MVSWSEFMSWRTRRALAVAVRALPRRAPTPIRRIFCVVEGGLGDRLMTLPALRHLRGSYPEATMTVAMSGPVPYLDGGFDQVVDWSSQSVIAKMRLARQRYDLCFVNSLGVYSPINELISLATGAWRRIGPRYANVSRTAYTEAFEYAANEHITVVNARAVGWKGPETALGYPLACPTRRTATDANELPIVLHPGCRDGYDSKRWPLDNFRQLAAILVSRWSCGVLVVGAPSEEPLIRTITLDLAGAASVATRDLADLADVLCNAAILVGNDSGPAHLAAALGRPTLVLMSATDPSRCAPVGKHVRVIHEPCDKGGCYYLRGAECRGCVGRIRPADVATEVMHLLGR